VGVCVVVQIIRVIALLGVLGVLLTAFLVYVVRGDTVPIELFGLLGTITAFLVYQEHTGKTKETETREHDGTG